MTADPTPAPPRIAALIVAAGRGQRAGGPLPKQFRAIGGRPVLRHTVERVLSVPGMTAVQVVRHPDDAALITMALDGLDTSRVPSPVDGGETRQASVRAGLEALRAVAPDMVLIHDAVRPFASVALFGAVVAALADAPGAVAALPVTDTLKRGTDGRIAGTVERAGLWSAQTPQGFRFDLLLGLHRAAAEAGRTDFTDDAGLLEWQGHGVALVPGEIDNFKITLPADFARADRRLAAAPEEVRTGIGYDVHAFGDGTFVTLGGVRIPHARGVLAHSDGDVVMHALVDALLGAINDGDIGQHFPPSDPRWRGAASGLFLAFAAERVRARGGRILNLDVTVVAEAPRVGPHAAAMREAIAAAAGVAPARVALKATTSERMGFTGRKEGLAALAVATVALPGDAP